ncbi:MAG: inner membrane protein YiaA [Verrucomicrobiota bacterium]
MNPKPSAAFVGASWMALIVGSLGYLIGLWRADAKDMLLNEKGFYFIVLMFGLFSTVSLQKSIRDRLDNIPVSDIYYAICWAAVMMSLLLLVVGLFNATLLPSEKGYYAFSFMFALFGAVAVQKNTRDSAYTPVAPV